MVERKTRQSFAPVRIDLVGFGVGGQFFHAPFIDAAQGVELAGVVTRSPERRSALAAEYPNVPAYPSLADLVSAQCGGAGIDAVTITTPPETRRDPVLEALALDLDVVADMQTSSGATLRRAGPALPSW